MAAFLQGVRSMSSDAPTAASVFAVAFGNIISWVVSVDFGAIATGITVVGPVALGGLVLVIKRVSRALTDASVERIHEEAKARREIEAEDKDSLSRQIEALRVENRTLMERLGTNVRSNTTAIDRLDHTPPEGA